MSDDDDYEACCNVNNPCADHAAREATEAERKRAIAAVRSFREDWPRSRLLLGDIEHKIASGWQPAPAEGAQQ